MGIVICAANCFYGRFVPLALANPVPFFLNHSAVAGGNQQRRGSFELFFDNEREIKDAAGRARS